MPVGRLWKAAAPRGSPDPIDMAHDLDFEFMDQTMELAYLGMDTFLAAF